MDVRNGKWLDRIWQSLDNYQLFCSAKNAEIQSHLMTLIARFLSSNQQDSGTGQESMEGATEGGTTKFAASVTGRHTRGEAQDAVWVLNAEVHLDADGEPITPDASPYAPFTSQGAATPMHRVAFCATTVWQHLSNSPCEPLPW